MNPLDRPSRGLALHNPQLLPKDVLARDFVARRADLARLVDDLRGRIGRAPQHHLVLGHRGMGKTTLLHRLSHVLDDDPELSAAYLPLVFPEEQYNVSRLSDLWLNCLDALSDRLELRGDVAGAAALDAVIDELHDLADDAQVEERALATLRERAPAFGRRLVLLIDNLDLVVDRIGKEREWAFRTVLEQSSELVVVGASAAGLESSYDYGAAFYDFFRVHRLGPLTAEEVREVLLALADRHEDERVRRIVEEQPGRVEAVRVLAGGNPRTIVTLYEVLASGPDGDVRADLEALLDRHTPLYKARFEELPPQAQQVVDALCLLWHPATARQVADHARMDVNVVSSQLARLQKDGIVEKAAGSGRGKGRTAFQVSERFFNIWYLIRASRRARRKLAWFVSFLEVLYGPGELFAQARRVLRDVQGSRAENVAELALALADAVNDVFVRQALVHRALEVAEREGLPLAADTDADLRAQEEVRRARRERLRRFDEAAAKLSEEGRKVAAEIRNMLCLDWETKLKVLDSIDAAPQLWMFLAAFEQVFWHAPIRRLASEFVASGAQLIDADVVGRIRLLYGPGVLRDLMIQMGATMEALAGILGPLAPATPKPDFERRTWLASNDPSGLGRATLASKHARYGAFDRAEAMMLDVLRNESIDPRTWILLMGVVARVVRAGRAARLAEALDEAGLSDRYRPLREALRAQVEPEHRSALAPEMAAAVVRLLRDLAIDVG